MDSKALGRVEIKDATQGRVSAVFSTFDVVDRDGDITVKGAIKHGTPVVISAYNHGSWQGSLPVGKGVIRVGDKEAVLEGQFFMNTAHGRDTFETVKALAEDGMGEWSYGFDVQDFEHKDVEGKNIRVLKALRVHEVSPVMLGAGVGTRTVGVKQDSGKDDSVLEEFTYEELIEAAFKAAKKPPKKKPPADDEEEDDPKKKPPKGEGKPKPEDDEEDDDEEKPPKRKPKKSLNLEISEAVDAVEAAIESAARVVALRAEKGKDLSLINQATLDALRTQIKALDRLLDQKDDNTSTEMHAIWLHSIAQGVSDE